MKLNFQVPPNDNRANTQAACDAAF